jgi:hypothetical protein
MRASCRLAVRIVSKLFIPSCAIDGFQLETQRRCFEPRSPVRTATRPLRPGGIRMSRGNKSVSRTDESVTGKINPIYICCQSCERRVPIIVARFCYPEPWK